MDKFVGDRVDMPDNCYPQIWLTLLKGQTGMVWGGKGVVPSASYVPSGFLLSVVLLMLVGAGAAFLVKLCDVASTAGKYGQLRQAWLRLFK